jgi:hypothetical protein
LRERNIYCQKKKQILWFALAKRHLQKRMKNQILISRSIAMIDALTSAYQLNVPLKLAQAVCIAKIGGFNFIKTHMCIQLRLKKRDGVFWLANLYLKAALLCNMWEKLYL